MPLTTAQEDSAGNRTALLLASMMTLVPAIGATTEDLLQDTLKSMLVAFFVLTAAWLHLWQVRRESLAVKVHWALLFPALLALHAISSTIWSHTYLGGVEATRWLLFGLIVLLGMRSLTPTRVTWIAWGIHLGAVLASLWAALQFWFDFQFFSQGPNPASTFVNRNFFAEFVVCTLPFSVLLLIRLEKKVSVFATVLALCFNVTALMMTGTRSALLALWILTPALLCIVWHYRRQVVSTGWTPILRLCLAALLVTALLGFGSLETHNARLLSESTQTSAVSRAFNRSLSLTKQSEYAKGSFTMRADMWAATTRMMMANPISGVGAGAWEVQIPRYQLPDRQLETDYYAHNEFLQLLAEYGLIGWVSLTGLLSYLAWAAYRTYADTSDAGYKEAPLRALALASLFALMVVSNAGFPWRLATTGALFALSLSILAASDIRLLRGSSKGLFELNWNPMRTWISLFITTLGAILAIFISAQAVSCEKKIMQAIKAATIISHSNTPQDIRWDHAKSELIALTREGVTINPHYRKLTPIVADSLANWGDWRNAIWIWESILMSRPYVIAIATNIARGYLQIGDYAKAEDYLERAKAVQPNAVSVKSFEVTLLSRTGHLPEAIAQAKKLLKAGILDRELVQTAYDMGKRNQDPNLAILAIEMGIKTWPARATDGWLKLGDIYSSADVKDDNKAIESYRKALDTSQGAHRASVLAQIPKQYLSEVQQQRR